MWRIRPRAQGRATWVVGGALGDRHEGFWTGAEAQAKLSIDAAQRARRNRRPESAIDAPLGRVSRLRSNTPPHRPQGDRLNLDRL